MSQENNFVPEQGTYKPLSSFQLFVKSNFPFIENTFEALDNYGLYCKIVEYLNTVIENENTVESNVTALYNAFVSLNNYVSDYFDNLDVQEEINNKLDEMAEDGSLYEIIRRYTDPIVNEQNDRINALASGSPAGAYPTLSALQTADPPHNHIYVVTATGYWYFYNTSNSTWTQGGIYQSSVNPIDTKMIISKNNYVLSEGENNGYFDGSSVVSSDSYTYTHFDAPFPFDEVDFENIQGNIGALFVKYDEDFIKYNVAGKYRVNVENAKELYLNFWGDTYASDFTLKNKQAISEINQKKLISNKTIFAKASPNNLIIYDDLIPNAYVDTRGREQSSNAFYVTPFIELDENQTTLTFLYGSLSCFYDENYVFISAVTSFANPVAIPNGAKYLRCSVATSALGYVVVNYGTESLYNDKGILELPYKPYQSGFIEITIENDKSFPVNDTTSETVESPDIVNTKFVLKLPKNYSIVGDPCKLIMFCHGAGRGVTIKHPTDNKSWTELASYNALVSKFTDNGYAVFDCDGIDDTFQGANFWGSPLGYNVWKKAYEYVVKNYNVEKDFSIYGFSMGGLTALNLLFNNLPNVKCVALGSPVIDLSKCWLDTAPKAQMKLSFDTQEYGENMVGYDPMSHIIDNKITANLPPIKIWYGSTETGLEVNKDIAKDFVDAIRNGGGVAIYREILNAGHEICYGENATCNNEYYYWIRRFQ